MWIQIRIQELCGYRSVFPIRIQIHICKFSRAVDPDPHSFYFRIRIQSGSRREKFSNKNRKNARKLVNQQVHLICTSFIVSYFWAIFNVFYNKRKLYTRIFLTNLFKLDPDPHFYSSWIRIPILKNCWIRKRLNGSTALKYRIE